VLLFLISYDAAVIEGAIIGKLVEPILQRADGMKLQSKGTCPPVSQTHTACLEPVLVLCAVPS
jgi:hypothetical protein